MYNERKQIRSLMNEVFEIDVESLHQKLVDMANQWDGKVYLVGGAVRDELLGKDPKDLDYVVTKINKDDLEKALLKTLPGSKIDQVGKSFGVVLVNIGDDQLEFALPRVDVDRENVSTDPNLSIEQDLLRRDLTINALAKDLETGEIHEPEGVDALDDLKNGIIRAVGDPQDRFKEDGLRILRTIRFASRMGFDIEPKTLRGIKVNLDELKNISPERFKGEFFNAWTKGLRDTEKFFELLEETGISKFMFGTEFDPIPLNLKDIEPEMAFRMQNISAFLKGGNFEVMNIKTNDKKDVLAGREFNDIIGQGYVTPVHSKNLNGLIDRLPIVYEIFQQIDKKKAKSLEEIFSKPAVKSMAKDESDWEPWMLPLKGGEIISIAEDAGVILKGKSIGEAESSLIQAYQKDKLKLGNDLEDSKRIAGEFLKNELLHHDRNINDSVRLDELRSRMKNILEN